MGEGSLWYDVLFLELPAVICPAQESRKDSRFFIYFMPVSEGMWMKTHLYILHARCKKHRLISQKGLLKLKIEKNMKGKKYFGIIKWIIIKKWKIIGLETISIVFKYNASHKSRNTLNAMCS